MDNYTKVNDKLVAKYGIKAAWIYAKLHYRMNLSNKHHKYYDKSHHSHYVVYKVDDLAKDCHMSRGTIIKNLKKLEKAGLIYKDRTMFCNHIYLPKFNCEFGVSPRMDKQSSKSELPREQKSKNKDTKNSVPSSTVHTVKRVKKYPKLSAIIKFYGKSLVHYAVQRYHTEAAKHVFTKIHKPYNYVVGILRRWHRKGIKDLPSAMRSEKDINYLDYENGPEIPIFKI